MFSGKNNKQHWAITTGFVYLFLVAILGVALRSNLWIQLPLPYTHILHAHSHTALLGWAFIMSAVGILSYLELDFANFKKIFIGLTVSIIGMFIAFLYQGYGPISIAFSTLFVLSAYVLLWKIYRVIKLKNRGSALFFKWAIIWFFISTIGIWCIAPISILLGKDHALYPLSIQFFMHFQMNGWLTFMALGLLFANAKKTNTKLIVFGLNLSLLLTFALNVYWVKDHFILYAFNVSGIIIQALVYGKIILHLIKSTNKNTHQPLVAWFYYLILVFIMIKPLLQLITLSPAWATDLVYNRFLIIAFLHLILIGIISYTFILNAIKQHWIPYNLITKAGIFLWIIGFLITEIVMALQGFGLYDFIFYYALWGFSIGMLLGITLLLYQHLRLVYGQAENKKEAY